MNTATISPKFQVVIPKAVREDLRLVPGQVVQVIGFGDRVEFLPLRTARDLRGMLRGHDLSFERDHGERL